MKIALCQINPVIGDIEGNKLKIQEGYERGVKDEVDLVIFPELSLCGYPPLDLVEKQEFRKVVADAADELAALSGNVGLLFGSVTEELDDVGTGLYNSAILCYDGKVQFMQQKTLLPNYDVFDEVRYFEPSKSVDVHEFHGEQLGISICEDIWNDDDYWKHRKYHRDPVQEIVDKGATILLNISASPYAYGRRKERYDMLSVLTKTDKLPLAYVCLTGAQTDLIFDGGSMCFNSNGELELLGRKYEEDYLIFDTDRSYETITDIEDSFEAEV
jgi:NAD+ synthase (glutamine-hydrolysing)